MNVELTKLREQLAAKDEEIKKIHMDWAAEAKMLSDQIEALQKLVDTQKLDREAGLGAELAKKALEE